MVSRWMLSAAYVAIAVAAPSCKDIHTWHNVTAYRGTWTAQLSSLSQTAKFVHPNCTEMSGATPNFEVVGGKPVAYDSATFGFKIAPGDTFNVAYSLSLVRTSEEPLNPGQVSSASKEEEHGEARQLFASMACTYVIAAAGPAMLDIRSEPFNGAVCLWERNPPYGENYQVDFPPTKPTAGTAIANIVSTPGTISEASTAGIMV